MQSLRLAELKMYDATLSSIKPTSISASLPIAPGAQSQAYSQPAALPDATPLIDGDHDSTWTYSSACAGCTLQLPVDLTVYLPAGSAATHYEMVTGGGSTADTDPISWTVSTGIAGGIPRDLIPLSEVSGHSGDPTTGIKPLILHPPSPPHPPSTPPPRPVRCFNFNYPGEALRQVRHTRPVKIRFDYAGHQTGDVAIWNRLDIGGCAGASTASSEFGGPLDELASQTISLPAGAYGLCLATGNGQPWLAPSQRGRALQVVDTNFEWLGDEVTLVSSYEPPSPPPMLPPISPLLANQTAEALTGSQALNGSNPDALAQQSDMSPLWLFWIIMGSVMLFCCCCCLCWFCCLRSRRSQKIRHRLSTVAKYTRRSARTKASLLGGEASGGEQYPAVEPATNQEMRAEKRDILREFRVAFMESAAELQAVRREKLDGQARTGQLHAGQRVASRAPMVIVDDFALSDDEGPEQIAAVGSVAVQMQWLERRVIQTEALSTTTAAGIPSSPAPLMPVPSVAPLAQSVPDEPRLDEGEIATELAALRKQRESADAPKGRPDAPKVPPPRGSYVMKKRTLSFERDTPDKPAMAAGSKALSPIVRRSQTTKQFMDDSKRAETIGLGV